MSLDKLLGQVYNNIFKFNNSDILLLFDKDNTIWLSFNSILKSIGYSDLKKYKQKITLDDKYFSTYELIYPQSKLNTIKIAYQKPNEKFINEAGLYLLLSKSSKPVAKELSEMLFTDVLPEIRKKGKFALNTTDRAGMNKLTQKLKNYQKEAKRTLKQSFPDKTGEGFIYVLKVPTTKNGVSKTCYKVGYTANLEKRVATYKTGNPDIELVHMENVECNKKQLEKCVLNLNTLKLLRNRTEVICDNSLKEIITEINDCKELLKKHSH